MQRAGWVLAGAGLGVAVATVVLFQASRSAPEAPPALDGPRASGLGPPENFAERLSPEARGPRPAAPSAEARSPRPEAQDAAVPEAPTASDLLTGVRSSGSAHEVWEDQARQLLGSLASGDTEATYAGCFVAGCAATVIFPTRAAYDAAVADTASGSAFRAWTGGKRWSRPDTAPGGQTSAALVLYRPD